MVEEITVFFPAFNEEDNIIPVVTKALEKLKTTAKNFEVLVINDGSRDLTRQRVEKLIESYPQVRLINHLENLGYGEALKSGFYNAKYNLIALNDGDGQFDFSEIDSFLQFIPEYDFVIGFRKKRVDPLHRRINAKLYRGFIWLVFGLRVHDIDCAFKVIKKEVIDQIPRLESSGALISAELLIKAQKAEFKVKEIPVTHYPRLAGTPTGANPKVVWLMFKEVVKFGRMLR